MLAAIIANLQNDQPQPKPRRMLRIDRGGGGPSWPGFQLVDIVGALEAFQEIPGEHPVARAARRHHHVGEHLNGVRETREAREAAAFLAGATIAQMAANEQLFESEAELDRVVAAYDSLRAAIQDAQADLASPNPWAEPEVARGGGAAALVVGIAIGVTVGLLARRRW